MSTAPEIPDPTVLADLRAFIAEHPQTCNAYVDVLLRRVLGELERLGGDRD